jgi:F-type H+-transporting ATPase subunit b
MPLAANALIQIIPGLMIWTIVSFALTLIVLKRYAFGPIQKVIDERRDRIRQSIDEADRVREEARNLLAENQRLIAAGKAQAEEILAEARRVAEAQRHRTLEEARADLERRLEENERAIEAANQRLVEQIRRDVIELTLLAAERVTGKVLDAEDQRRLIDEAVGEIDFERLGSRN